MCKLVILDSIFGNSRLEELLLSITFSTKGSTEYLIPPKSDIFPSNLNLMKEKATIRAIVKIVHIPPTEELKLFSPL